MAGGLLASGSVLAAFLAGGVALFAPCCTVFLAPGSLALAARNHRWRLLPLTFVFTAGLALVLVPITIGVSLVAATIARFHAPLYYAGEAVLGLALLALAAVFVLAILHDRRQPPRSTQPPAADDPAEPSAAMDPGPDAGADHCHASARRQQ